MYNKLFTQILDSSVWLAPDPHRLVWITFLAAMDRDGFARFACVENLAARARVNVEDAKAALAFFEGPDPHDPAQEFEGRRIERVPGGWMVLNAAKYRDLVTAAVSRERTRERVSRHRARKAGNVTPCNAAVTPCNGVYGNVTPSYSVSVSNHQNSESVAPVDNLAHPESRTPLNGSGRTIRIQTPAEVWKLLISTDGKAPERNPTIQRAIDSIGGWAAVAQRTALNCAKLEAAFCAAYLTPP